MKSLRATRVVAAAALGLALGSCGGGGGGSGTIPVAPAVGANQLLVTIEQNPAIPASVNVTANIPYVPVTVCNLSSQCATVDHVVLDTGSYGLRVLQGALGGLSLPVDAATGGTQLAECAHFLDGHIWGAVSHATLQLGGETTSSLPIQVIGASTLPAAPADCASAGSDVGSLQALGGNGLLGVGQFIADGQAYYACTASGCTSLSPPPASAQVSNPVPFVNSADNNGIVLQMPSIPTSGAGVSYGVLSLGAGTQADNALSGYTALAADSGGDITITVQGVAYPGSFLDSGSNFSFASLSGVPTDANGNYTPASLLNLPITLSTSSGTIPPASLNAQMYVGDYSSMDFSSYVAFNDLAAQVPSTSPVDLGLPFFYGRSVAYVIQGMSSPLGSGPLYALR